jgi:hypothetical protein
VNVCKCGAEMHRDFPDKTERCSGCDRTAAWCRCAKVAPKYVPLWRRNLAAKDMTGAAA